MKKLTLEMLAALNSVNMTMHHAEAIRMDHARDEAIKAHGPGLVCQHQYTTDFLGRPALVIDESELPY